VTHAKALQGVGPPSFCWYCHKNFMHVKGWRGPYFYALVVDSAGVEHRVHSACVRHAVDDGSAKPKKEA
jgi:hypothetical protein